MGRPEVSASVLEDLHRSDLSPARESNMQHQHQHQFRDPRIAAIAARARDLESRMEDDSSADSGGSSSESGSSSGSSESASSSNGSRGSSGKAGSGSSGSGNAGGGSSSRSKSDDSSGNGDDAGEGTDWRSESRKHESRAKAAKTAADKAAEEKDAAEAHRKQIEEQHKEFTDGLAKLLGYKEDDKPPDPAKLQQVITEREAKVTELERTVSSKDEEIGNRDKELGAREVELAAWRESVRQGVDATTLMDLRSTDKALRKLDPSADDFEDQLKATVKDLVKDNPRLRGKQDEASASEAGIGASGNSNDAAASAAPGLARMRAAYGVKEKTNS